LLRLPLPLHFLFQLPGEDALGGDRLDLFAFLKYFFGLHFFTLASDQQKRASQHVRNGTDVALGDGTQIASTGMKNQHDSKTSHAVVRMSVATVNRRDCVNLLPTYAQREIVHLKRLRARERASKEALGFLD